MRHPALSETLVALVEALPLPAAAGVAVVEAMLEVPLEVWSGTDDGQLVFYAAPPHTRWKSGFLPSTHKSRLRVEPVFVDALKAKETARA